jgi:YVTN family beta-propeller protein
MNKGDNTITGNFSVNRPYEMVVNSETGILYVTSDANDIVYSIDLETARVLSTFQIPDPCGIAIDVQNNIVYVSSESSGRVHVIDGSANKTRATIPVGEGPRGLAFNPKTNMLLVANTASDSVSVIDNVAQRVINTIGVDKAPRRIAVNPDTNIAYVIGQNTLNFLDLSSYSVIRSVPLKSSYDIALNTDENLVYVTNSNSDFVYVIDGYERKVVSPFPYTDLVIALIGIAGGAVIVILVWRNIQGQKT